jgi:hypothetical protein
MVDATGMTVNVLVQISCKSVKAAFSYQKCGFLYDILL